MEKVRLRLSFHESLKISDGFKRFWVVLKPHHRTISDFSNHLLDAFQLRNSCPEGLLLSMEGFFLPPFESIRLFKDGDLVRVKRKEKGNLGMMLELVGNLLLENQEFDKVKEVKKVLKKRKAIEEVGSSSKKKNKKNKEKERSSGDRKAKKATSMFVNGDKKDEEDDPKDNELHRNVTKSTETNSGLNGHVDASCTPSETKKIPSRSSRRKKAKRQWLKELRRSNKEEEEKQVSATCYEKPSRKKNRKVNEEPPEMVTDTAEDNEKIENTALCKCNGNGISSSQDDPNSSHKPSGCPVFNQIIDFDKLPPYSNSPKEADIIAYRIVQLTSSWTPEVSSYLVGKISQFNPESNMIKLVAVPKYPLIPETKMEDDEAPEVLPETCILQEDGSLEIEFSSLVEIRAVKNQSSTNDRSIHTSGQGRYSSERRESTNHQDEFSRRVLQEDYDWDISESSGRDQWTLKALRRSAIGPTMALLRSQNEI